MIVVADASAATKLVIGEPGSDLVRRLWDDSVTWVAPTIVLPEVASAITAADRDGRLPRNSVEDVHAEWRSLAADVALRGVDVEVARQAGTLAASDAIRGADAVYIALAQTLAGHTDVVLASFDQPQRGAALGAGVAVVPGDL